MSRTAIATLVFEDDGHREAWLEEHGVVPKRHGDYLRVAERVDYEHVRENPVIVFNIPRPERATREEPVPLGEPETGHLADFVDAAHTAALHPAPPDGELPFPGRFHGKLLSALTEPEARALADALARSANAEHVNKAFVETWQRRVSAWAHYRGWNS